MSVPIRVSQLTQISPVLSGDQILLARGNGATGESYRALAKDVVRDLLSATNTATVNLSFDKTKGVFSGDVASVPANKGGTGITSYLPGQVLIGSSTGSLVANYLTPGPRMTITNSGGSVTLTPSATNLSVSYAPSSANIIPTTGTQATLSAATNASAGLMTNADRVKLDGIETNANKYIHPSYSWTNTNLGSTTVIANLSMDSTGHLTNWVTRTMGTMSIQDSNAVNITGGTVEATGAIKSYNPSRSTMFASIGPDSLSASGLITLLNSGGPSYTIAASSVVLADLITYPGITTNNHLCIQGNVYTKGVSYAEGGFQYWSGTGWSAITMVSDARVKEVTSKYTQGLEDVVKLNPVKFKYKNNIEPFLGDNERVGLIAQEVKPIFPNCVYQSKEKLDGVEQEVYKLHINDLTFAFINAFKELNEKYETLEKKYNALVSKLDGDK